MKTNLPPSAILLRVLALAIAVSAVGCTFIGTRHEVPSIEGTKWTGDDSDHERLICEFRRGGNLHYFDASGEHDGATWSQAGASVYMEMNHKYAQYHGRIDGTHMRGTARNIVHKSWTWQLSLEK